MTAADVGQYTCTATNLLGSTTVTFNVHLSGQSPMQFIRFYVIVASVAIMTRTLRGGRGGGSGSGCGEFCGL